MRVSHSYVISVVILISQYHQQQERVFVERLFYLILNNVELTLFSTFNINSIISISKELEKYQRSTNKTILNTDKLNTIVRFVLSYSSSAVAIFQINNLFYLLLNDMNDFSGKIIDRIAELLRVYHSMTYGHAITKQTLINNVGYFSFFYQPSCYFSFLLDRQCYQYCQLYKSNRLSSL